MSGTGEVRSRYTFVTHHLLFYPDCFTATSNFQFADKALMSFIVIRG